MYVADWVDLTDANDETVTSQFLEQVTWRTKDPHPLESDTYGELIVWIRNDEELKKYMYPNVKREIYEKLREEAYNGYKPGSIFNRDVRGNNTVGEPAAPDSA